MHKGLLTKTLRKKLGCKKQAKTARTLEKKIKSSLSRQAQKLAEELQSVEKQLVSLPDRDSEHWLWLADIRRAGHLMEQVMEVLEEAKTSSETLGAGDTPRNGNGASGGGLFADHNTPSSDNLPLLFPTP